jgi:predicted RNase H-like HicB family nuclease
MQALEYVYWEDDGAWLGYLHAFPYNWTQGETLDDFKEHLYDLFADLTSREIQWPSEFP